MKTQCNKCKRMFVPIQQIRTNEDGTVEKFFQCTNVRCNEKYLFMIEDDVIRGLLEQRQAITEQIKARNDELLNIARRRAENGVSIADGR